MPHLYRPCVGITLFNDQGKVFVGERIDTPGAWQMPQGGIDNGEEISTAALRELKEEIGTDQAEIIEILETPLRYDFPVELAQRLWKGRYKGQEQFWTAARFTGADTDIILDAFDPPEFQQWQWASIDDIMDLIVPFKKDVYANVIKAFKEHTI